MNTLTLIFVALIAAGGYHYYQEQKKQAAAGGEQVASAATRTAASGAFMEVPDIKGDDGSVLVVAQENCPAAEAQRADKLAQDLGREGVRVRRVHGIEFPAFDPQQYQIDRLNALMNGQLPIVFVKGRGKANPTLAEVLAEYKK